MGMIKCAVSVKSSADRAANNHTDRVSETSTNSQDDQDLAGWLGGRDSNPDNVVQRGKKRRR